MTSSVRVCPGCKWEFPLSYVKQKCRFCKTEFDTVRCIDCGQFTPASERWRVGTGTLSYRCRPCQSKQKRAWDIANHERHLNHLREHVERRRAAAEKLYEEVLSLTEIPFKTLSEAEWIETCRYFKGCAICGEDHIESRQFFVGFQHGGKYAVWNMIPMCGKCSTVTRIVRNPFVWIDKEIGYAKRAGLNDERREKLLDFITSQIEKVKS